MRKRNVSKTFPTKSLPLVPQRRLFVYSSNWVSRVKGRSGNSDRTVGTTQTDTLILDLYIRTWNGGVVSGRDNSRFSRGSFASLPPLWERVVVVKQELLKIFEASAKIPRQFRLLRQLSRVQSDVRRTLSRPWDHKHRNSRVGSSVVSSLRVLLGSHASSCEKPKVSGQDRRDLGLGDETQIPVDPASTTQVHLLLWGGGPCRRLSDRSCHHRKISRTSLLRNILVQRRCTPTFSGLDSQQRAGSNRWLTRRVITSDLELQKFILHSTNVSLQVVGRKINGSLVPSSSSFLDFIPLKLSVPTGN